MAVAKAFNLPARAVYNDLHAYVEVKLDNQYQKADLGGAPANVTLIPPPKIADKPLKTDKSLNQIRKEISPDNPFRTWDTAAIKADSINEYAQKLLEQADTLDRGRKNVLSTMNPEQMSALSAAILQQKQRNCFYLSDLNNIRERQTVIDNEAGCLKQQDSSLKQFLKHAQSGDVLLVNWSDYRTIHMGYNSMMEPERKIKGMNIPKDVIVMGMLEHNQTMGEEFYSRFRKVSDCPAQLTSVDWLPRPEKPDQKTTSFCFYDDAWRSVLLGESAPPMGVIISQHLLYYRLYNQVKKA